MLILRELLGRYISALIIGGDSDSPIKMTATMACAWFITSFAILALLVMVTGHSVVLSNISMAAVIVAVGVPVTVGVILTAFTITYETFIGPIVTAVLIIALVITGLILVYEVAVGGWAALGFG